MMAVICASLLLIGYGVLAVFILLGLFILYAAADEIVRYLINKPRKKDY
jgi:hypothetical protein